MLKNDRHYLYLTITTAAFLSGLIWLFFGETLVSYYVNKYEIPMAFSFLSGIMVMVIAVGLYTLTRIILNYTGWVADDETIQLTIYNNILDEEAEGLFFKDRRGYYRLISVCAEFL